MPSPTDIFIIVRANGGSVERRAPKVHDITQPPMHAPREMRITRCGWMGSVWKSSALAYIMCIYSDGCGVASLCLFSANYRPSNWILKAFHNSLIKFPMGALPSNFAHSAKFICRSASVCESDEISARQAA